MNPDQRRGIPIPFVVRDAEPDPDLVPVRLVFQWRRADQSFDDPDLELPADREAMEAILEDPLERRRRQIAIERPRTATGVVEDPGERTVRLANLRMHHQITADLEVLRPSHVPTALVGEWDLVRPVAAIPMGDGRTALVLDAPAAGSWRLREMELSSGAAVREIAGVHSGDPVALEREVGGSFALVVSGDATSWHVSRVGLDEEGEVTRLVTVEDDDLQPVRDLKSTGSRTALVTAGDALLALDFVDHGPSRVIPLVRELQGPWGIAVDPRHANRICLAEQNWTNPGTGTVEGRIVSLDLNTLAVTMAVEGTRFPRPRSLALDHRDTRLLAVTDDKSDGVLELRGVELGTAHAEIFEIVSGIGGEVGGLATGPDGLRVLSLTGSGRLAVGGGIEQRRTVVHFDPITCEALVDRAFEPPLGNLAKWRVALRSSLVRAAPEGTRGTFLWDADDVLQGGRVLLRALPYDGERGVGEELGFERQIAHRLEGEALRLGDASTALPLSLSAADLDSDGDLDLIAGIGGLEEERSIAVFLQTAPRKFGNPDTPGRPDLILGVKRGEPRDLCVADLDGDGRQDIVTANQQGNGLSLYFQTNAGEFRTVPLGKPTAGQLRRGDPTAGDSATGNPRGVTAADLDGDGWLDLATANNSSHNLTVFYQEGSGSFSVDPLALGGVGVTTGATAVAAADLDRDGRLDLVSANEGADSLTVFFQGSDGFDPEPLVLGSGTLRGPRDVRIADLDGDGQLDLVSANSLGHNLAVFLQADSRRFGLSGEPNLTLGDSDTTGSPFELAVVDVNSDGFLDLVTAAHETDHAAVFFQISRGIFEPEPLLVGDTETAGGPRAIAAADLDGDGWTDVVTANGGSGGLSVFFQQSPRTFWLAEPDLTIEDRDDAHEDRIRSPVDIEAVDLDGDLNLDLLSANKQGKNLTAFFQTRPGALSDEPLTLGGPAGAGTVGPAAVAAADVDGNGLVDVISADQDGDALSIFLQEAAGVVGQNGDPAQPNLSLEIADPSDVRAVDLDGDGDFDLIAASRAGDSLVVFLRLSPHSPLVFDPPLELGGEATTNGPVSLEAADLNGDARLDLVSANASGDNLTVFLQTETGFESQPDVKLGDPPLVDDPRSVVAADLDGDGDLDLASANRASENLTVFFQEGESVFDPVPLVLGSPNLHAALSLAVADLDGDGDHDLVAAFRDNDAIAVFFHKRPGRFGIPGGPAQPDLTLDAHRPDTVLVVDLDGDADMDIVSANRQANSLTVFFGAH